MSDESEQRVNSLGEPTFVLDRNLLVTESREALKTFFAPFSGVARALRGSGLGGRPAQAQYRAQTEQHGILRPRAPD